MSREVDFKTIEAAVPDIYVSSERHIRALPRPRIIKSHQRVTSDYRRVLYLVREPSDVAVSYHRFLKRAGSPLGELELNQFFEHFVREPGPIPEFGTWGGHVEGWLQRRETDPASISVVRYENLVAEPTRCLKEIADFCGLQVADGDIQTAIVRSDADRMRAMEREVKGAFGKAAANAESVPFVGDARPGDGRAKFSPDAHALLRERWAPIMGKVGYLD